MNARKRNWQFLMYESMIQIKFFLPEFDSFFNLARVLVLLCIVLATHRREWALQFDTTGKPALDQAKMPPARDFALAYPACFIMLAAMLDR